MAPAIRPWCAVAQYPGKLSFLVGTVQVPATARHDEIIAALRDYALTFLPDGFDIIEPRCGSLFFQEAA